MEEFVEPSGGYGRIWECMYEGSMVGAGPEVFCLWPYVIAKMRKQPGGVATVLLNPTFLAGVFGVVDEGFVRRGIEKLCEPDKASKNGVEEDGRRLVRVSGHLYRVVNGARYIELRAKERHAAAQARYRQRQGKKGVKRGKMLTGEAVAVAADRRGDVETFDRMTGERSAV